MNLISSKTIDYYMIIIIFSVVENQTDILTDTTLLNSTVTKLKDK